eukprot:scaffold302386_cov76-Cyclotella_meneghiniana.AAC.3
MATTFFDCCNKGTVMFPVPGPISNTTSVDFKAALATMAVTTAGFLRKCCPNDVLGAIRLAPDDFSAASFDEWWDGWREDME